VKKLSVLLEKNGRSNNNLIKFQSYVKLWLATLYVVAEGFQTDQVKNYFLNCGIDLDNKDDLSMKVYWNSIHHKIAKFGNQLKSYRNVTLHFQPSHTRLLEKRLSFLKHESRHSPIEWAVELQREMRLFFGEYRPRAAAMLFLAASKLKKPVGVDTASLRNNRHPGAETLVSGRRLRQRPLNIEYDISPHRVAHLSQRRHSSVQTSEQRGERGIFYKIRHNICGNSPYGIARSYCRQEDVSCIAGRILL
jgi:hypothetical protein